MMQSAMLSVSVNNQIFFDNWTVTIAIPAINKTKFCFFGSFLNFLPKKTARVKKIANVKVTVKRC